MTALMKKNSLTGTSGFRVKDPVSAGTHFAGALLAVTGTPVLLLHDLNRGAQGAEVFSLAVFMASMILLYTASTVYHTFDLPGEKGLILKRIDHMSIFVLIAGTYTPCCLSIISGDDGMQLLAAVWLIALAGIVFKLCWVTCPRWVSSVIYIMMGWAVLWKMPALLAGITPHGFALLLAGGLFYTAGGVIYALKLRLFPPNDIGFGNHEFFHIMVMIGSFLHWLMIFTI